MVLLARSEQAMQLQDSNPKNEFMGTRYMRAANGDDCSLVKTVSQDCETAILQTPGRSVDSQSNPAIQAQACTVAVTTSPRRHCTLELCLASIDVCGWDPIVFAEPGSTLTEYQTIENTSRLGVWHNWLNSVRWCLEHTRTPRILTVQDDSLFHPDSKRFVDAMIWPSNCGFVSLYTPKHYSIGKRGQIRPRGINRISTKSLWGACALLWERQILEQVVETPTCRYWQGAKPKSGNAAVMERRKQNPELIANSDTAIGKAVNRLGLAMYFVDPSPVHHIAKYSTILHGDNSGRRNCYRCADFDRPLADQVYGASR
jgi:hypothetical protein